MQARDVQALQEAAGELREADLHRAAGECARPRHGRHQGEWIAIFWPLLLPKATQPPFLFVKEEWFPYFRADVFIALSHSEILAH